MCALRITGHETLMESPPVPVGMRILDQELLRGKDGVGGIGVLPQKVTLLSICLAAVQLVFESLASVRCVDGFRGEL